MLYVLLFQKEQSLMTIPYCYNKMEKYRFQ